MAIAAARAPAIGFWDWSVDVPLVLVIVVAVMYGVGSRRTPVPESAAGIHRWRTASFLTGLLVVAVALDSPIDPLSERLFWVHMVQHVLLIMVAPPLILLGRPWSRLWRALPLGWRRDLGRGLMAGSAGISLRRAARGIGTPWAGLAVFSVVLLAWHIPVLFDATLRSAPLHVLEHEMFFVAALLFWKQVIASPPLRARLEPVGRLAHLTAAMVVSWVLAIVLALAPQPLYAHYAHELARPGGISALSDQQLAAGIMWVPGSIAFLIAMFAALQRWLAPEPARRVPAPVVGVRADPLARRS